MTKYVLNSGYEFKYPLKASKFIEEMIPDEKKAFSVLIVNFAQRRNMWEEKYEKLQKSINTFLPVGHIISYSLAFPDIFRKQCEQADVIYIQGGEDNLLKFYLDQFTDLESFFKNKTVVSSSAGSNYLSSYYWTCDWRSHFTGSHILPIKFLPHYLSDYGSKNPLGKINWNKALKELKNYGDDSLPVHALEEGDYVVIQK